jgi:hypothetical protein
MKNFTKRSFSAFFGLAMAFTLLMNVTTTYAQYECNSLGAPLSTTGDISLSDTVQSVRLFRDGRNTTCFFNRTATTSAVSVNADQYTFTNTAATPACITVDLDATGCGAATNQIGMAAYLGSYNSASILTNLIADPGLSTGQNFATSMTFNVAAGATYVIVVHTINNATTCPSYTFKRYVSNNCRQNGYDAANDGSADLALFRPSGGLATFQSETVTGGSPTNTQLGSSGDIPVPGDYTGDETTDNAVFRPTNGTWYTTTNPATNYGAQKWGASGDIPVQGDYDRDGITDLAVFRPSDNNWYILRSATSAYSVSNLGATGDKPVPADYDGDLKMDVAVYRPSISSWLILPSSGNSGSFTQTQYGISTDTPVPADYDGDGKADLAVFRPSTGEWYVFRSSLTTAQSLTIPFGLSGDIPQPADYDGDKKADQAVFRPSNNTWYVLRSTAGFVQTSFGQSGDIPATAPNTIQ